jgi:hypothetical protein
LVPSVDLAGALEAVAAAGALPAVEAGLGAISNNSEAIGKGQRVVVD